MASTSVGGIIFAISCQGLLLSREMCNAACGLTGGAKLALNTEEKSTMSILRVSSMDEALHSARIKSLSKRAATMVGTLVLATSFALAGGPSAAASPVADLRPDCGGNRPGACPGWPPGPGMSQTHHMCGGGTPGMCPGWPPGPGRPPVSLNNGPVARCGGQTPGICP